MMYILNTYTYVLFNSNELTLLFTLLTLIASEGKSNWIVSRGGGQICPNDFLAFLLLKSKEKLILCLSCNLCNIWMNTFDFIGN